MQEDHLDTILTTLAHHPRVSDWVARRIMQTGTQLFLIGTEPEALRHVSTERYEITVYSDHERGRGKTTVSLTAAEMPILDKRLDEAAFMAGLSGNPPYALPGPEPLPDVKLSDEAIATPEGAESSAARLRSEVVEAVQSERAVRLSSLEAFLESGEVTLRSSTGVEAVSRGTKVTLDLALISRRPSNGEESESQETWARRRLDDLDVPGLVRRQAGYARDSLDATLPPTGQYPVVIGAEALQGLLRPITFRASAAARFARYSPWEIGQRVLAAGEGAEEAELTPDPVALISDATLPFGTRSRVFDDEGVPGKRITLIEDGTLKNYWAEQRYATYLGVPATGPTGTLVLNGGKQTERELLAPTSGPICHVVTFSFMDPDDITGDFSGEIRLGYLITSEGTKPIKGGTVSGNIFSAFARARLSSDTVFLGEYRGPSVVRFDNQTLTGNP
ncbi:MAG: metallopeptidase TldD-related protein [Chloroflexia bacterium]